MPFFAPVHHQQVRTPHDPVVGSVDVWHPEEGWGVLRTPDGLSVWCHFSQVVLDGYRELLPEERVRFDYETPGQDGCDGRVLTAAQPAGADGPVPPTPSPPPQGTSSAYRSSLTITFDDE